MGGRDGVGWLLLAMLLLVGCAGSGAEPGAPTAAAGMGEGVWLRAEREGGIAGFCEAIEVREGEVALTRCGEAPVSRALPDAVGAELATLVAEYGAIDREQEDNPGGPDNMRTRLTFAGEGSRPVTVEVEQQLQRLVDELFATMAGP